MNTYGERFRVTTFGESHGAATGAVVDGCPAGVRIDMEAIGNTLTRRRNGAPRQEDDAMQWLSGLSDGISLGTPICFAIGNSNARPDDYDKLQHLFRPGHADYTYFRKYGLRDHRGGGRASARETTARCVAGTIARQLMPEVDIHAEVESLGPDLENDTRGGTVRCRITGLPAGVGEPLFGKLGATLAAAMMSIPSAIGFEVGAGFAATRMAGSEYIDRWHPDADGRTLTNHCGGMQGGISNGMPVEFGVGGRHDRCAVLRAPVIVESMAALCLINYLL